MPAPGRIVARVRISNSWRRVVPAAALVLASMTVAGCGAGSEDDGAAICSSVASLKSSVGDITDVKINRDSLATLQDKVDKLRSDLSKVRTDAKKEYAAEV